jgi:hypothetical protein
MTKRITQETFDEVVRENIEDFEMELKQAIEDAANQFRSQGNMQRCKECGDMWL